MHLYKTYKLQLQAAVDPSSLIRDDQGVKNYGNVIEIISALLPIANIITSENNRLISESHIN